MRVHHVRRNGQDVAAATSGGHDITITGLSVAVALIIAGIEITSILRKGSSDQDGPWPGSARST
jgi:hypothetical protein